MARYSLLPSFIFSYQKKTAEEVYNTIRSWGAAVVNELEFRDQVVDATPASHIYTVVTVTNIGRPLAGDIAYSASTGKFKGYVSSGSTTEWQNLN
jgi:hypothetical protein